MSESQTTATKTAQPVSQDSDARTSPQRGSSSARPSFRKNKRRPARRERPRSEFDQKILSIRRVTRVAAGGRRFTFSVAIVVGDKKGKIGVGTGKAGDTSLAIDKAVRVAKKNAIKINTTADMSIPHEVSAKYCSGRVKMMPAPGRGIIAGSAVRDIINLSGLKDINAKILSGSKNKLNIAQATVKALQELKKPRESKKAKTADTKDKALPATK